MVGTDRARPAGTIPVTQTPADRCLSDRDGSKKKHFVFTPTKGDILEIKNIKGPSAIF